MDADNKMDTKPKLQLKSGEIPLGNLEEYNFDWPWVYCYFEPTEAFKEVKPLLKLVEEATNEESFKKAWEALKALNLFIIDLNTGRVDKNLLLSVHESVLFGTEIWFRDFDF